MKLIIHHNDMDGKSAAYLAAKYADSSEIEFLEVDYSRSVVNSSYVEFGNYDEVIIVDVSLNTSTILEFERIAELTKLTWIDHHQSSVDLSTEVLRSSPGIRSVKYCATYLVYAYYEHNITSDAQLDKLDESIVPEWIRLVDDYDTFKLKMPASRPFQFYYNSMNSDPSNYEFYEELINTPIDRITTIGNCLINNYDSTASRLRNSIGYEAMFEGHLIYVMNNRGGVRQFGDKVTQYDFLCSWVFTGEVYSYSLYRGKDKSLDLSTIAKKYGGGGHKAACGFSHNELILHKASPAIKLKDDISTDTDYLGMSGKVVNDKVILDIYADITKYGRLLKSTDTKIKSYPGLKVYYNISSGDLFIRVSTELYSDPGYLDFIYDLTSTPLSSNCKL